MQYRTFLLVLGAAGLLAARPSHAQTFLDDALVQIGGTGLVQTTATYAAPDGSFYVAGAFTGQVDVGGTVFTATDDADPFVARFEAGGQLDWACRAAGLTLADDGASLDGVTSLAVDASGNVYVGGGFVGGLDFKGSDGTTTVASLEQTGGAAVPSFEAFVAKYGPDCAVQWAVGGDGDTRAAGERIDLFGVETVDALAVDAAGNVYVAGSFSGDRYLGLAFSDPDVDVTGKSSPIVARLDPADGSVRWMTAGVPFGAEEGDLWGGTFTSMAMGGSALYVLGTYSGTLQFGYTEGPDAAPEPSFATFDEVEALGVSVVQLDPATGQNAITAYLYADAGSFAMNDIAADADDNLYLVGYYQEAGDEGDEGRDGLVVKYDAALDDVWQILFESVGSSADATVTGVRVDDAGIPYVAGSYSGVLLFGSLDDGAEQRGLSAGAGRATFVAMLTTAGTPQWVRNVAGAGDVGESLVDEASNGLVTGGYPPVQFTLQDFPAPAAADRVRLTSTFSGALDLAGDTQEADGFDAFSGLMELPLVTFYSEAFDVEGGFNYNVFDGIDDESYVGFFDEGPGDIATLTVTVAPGTAPPDMPEGTMAVHRYYHVTANEWDASVSTGFDADLNLCYTVDELVAGGLDPANEDRLELYRYDGLTWERVGGEVDTGAHCVYVDGVGAFSDWAIADPFDAPLPVELVSFTGTYDGAAVTLAWQTASETNNAGFEIQRLSNAETGNAASETPSWEVVGFVAGAGTSLAPRRYRYVDPGAAAGPVRYRLKQIDRDGQFAYSPEVEVDPGLPLQFALKPNYPNPFNPQTTLAYELPRRAEVRLTVYDALGREVALLADGMQEAGRHEVRFDAAALPSGTYFGRLKAGGFVQSRAMVLVR